MLRQGDTVKYSNPEPGESQFRFVVLEAHYDVRVPRVTVRSIDSSWRSGLVDLSPTFTHSASEYVLAND
jgi:hypothetical protein